MEISHYTTNDSPNAIRVDMGLTSFWFSYETIVAFYTPWTGKIVSENVWTRTTGKHLNAICTDHTLRTKHDVFGQMMHDVLWRISLCLRHADDLELLRRIEDAAEEAERHGKATA